MDNILEALKGLLPEEQVKELSSAVAAQLAEARNELEAEANAKLQEAFEELSVEKTQAVEAAEKVAYEGYSQAWGIIQDLRTRMEKMRLEYQTALDQGFEEAFQLIQNEKSKNETLAADLYEEYDRRLAEVKEYIVDKVDEFLQYKGTEIYEQARRDVLSDPRMAEHKVALEKIIDITSTYMSDEDHAFATSSKLEEAKKEAESLKTQLKIQEGRNVKLSLENTKLNEAVAKASHETALNEAEVKKAERKESAEAAKKVSGRGQIVLEEGLIAEYGSATNRSKKNVSAEDTRLDEGADEFFEMKMLAGVIKPD
jgi:hypothetical protein